MSAASDGLRAFIRMRFGSLNPKGPLDFLKEQGYIIDKRGVIRPSPAKMEERIVTEFLIQEWDYSYLDEGSD